MKEWNITKESELLSFLLSVDISHKKAKTLLKYRKVKVNGNVQTKYNFLLKRNDHLIIDYRNHQNSEHLEILYEDKNLIAVNKKAGLLTISTLKEKEKTLYHLVSDYCKSVSPKQKIFVLHRLDRETSGIVMFAKNKKIKEYLQKNWDQLVQKRGYIAVIEGVPSKSKDTITSYLYESANQRVYCSHNAQKGKKAITQYELIKKNEKYSILDIEIKTGRKNQIRVQMQSLGHPIVGDKKYGSNQNVFHRLALHADEFIFIHPQTKKIIKIECPIHFHI